MNLQNIIKEKMKKPHVWILFLIVAMGIFLRTWHFRDWLYFYPDQARDVMITRDYLDGKAPLPLLGPIAASTQFKIGPMYYYFQIISGKIFGVRPETMAYPDLFFGILTIPLFYFFLKRYFSTNLSLALTGLFSFSFFAVKYSRFAWNSNPIPFFMLLFMLVILEFLEHKEKTSWFWVAMAGISLGIGLQLHTILFVLMPVMSLLLFTYLFAKNPHIWKKGLVVLTIALALDAGMLTSEWRTGFQNTRILLRVSEGGSQNAHSSFFNSLKWDNLCHVQANAYIVSSLGDKEECSFINTLDEQKNFFNNLNEWPTIGLIASVVFSVLGYGVLTYRFFREEDIQKKYFLGLVLLIIIFSYVLLFTVAESLLLRYFIHLFFVPFLFLGIFVDYLKRYSKIAYLSIVVLAFIFLLFSNAFTIASEAQAYTDRTRSDSKYVVLGEIESMADYMISHSSGHEAYFTGSNDYFWNFYKPLMYVCAEKGFTLERGEKVWKVPAGVDLYALYRPSSDPMSLEINQHRVINYKGFGQIGMYKLEN